MSHKTFIAAIIGLIIVGLVASTLISDTKESKGLPVGEPMVTEEPVVEEPSTRPQGKIDVRVACESALMYTTFTDGAAADAFIAECVEGKHPDVIDRYIESLGVDGATI